MKLSDYVAQFLADKKIEHVFVVSGGAALSLIDSISRADDIDYVCSQHEQSAAMAADAYARISGGLGAAVATSGPGITNMITGIGCSYYDSIPSIFIAGQVATFRQKGDLSVRQVGFQETDTVSIFKGITKYCAELSDPAQIRFELEKCAHIAISGRPGPVLLSLPDDLQRAEVDPACMPRFSPHQCDQPIAHETLEQSVVELIRGAVRPVLIFGNGIRLAKAERQAIAVAEKLGIPIAPTWAAVDLLDFDHWLTTGTFGTHGTRHGNFAVQNSDLVISVGARLDSKATGSPPNSFARAAKKVVVDIDRAELDKFANLGVNTAMLVQQDALEFLEALSAEISMLKFALPDFKDWRERVRYWRHRYPICPHSFYEQRQINPYVFMKKLALNCDNDAVVCVDTGCSVAWLMQAFEVKSGQRIIHDCNNTAMGWSIPAAIASCFAKPTSEVVCVIGDGSFLMAMQELATIKKHELPIKIFVMDNQGHAMIRQTQDQWFGSKYFASSPQGGLPEPDFEAIGKAFGLRTTLMSDASELDRALAEVFSDLGPSLCVVSINAEYRVVPQARFGRPNEDQEPLLSRKELKENMFIPILDT